MPTARQDIVDLTFHLEVSIPQPSERYNLHVDWSEQDDAFVATAQNFLRSLRLGTPALSP